MRLILLNDDAKRIACTPEDMKALREYAKRGTYSVSPEPNLQVPLLDLRGVENVRPEAAAEAVRSALARSQGIEPIIPPEPRIKPWDPDVLNQEAEHHRRRRT